jgi:hypothetical protein
MYAVTATYDGALSSFRVVCGNSAGKPTRESFDHAARDAGESAIVAHVARCVGCSRMIETGYALLYATLPAGHDGRTDGPTVAVWTHQDSDR